MKPLAVVSLIALSLSLAACGGSETGGTGIASAPPPTSGPISVTSQTIISRTPLPPTVATTAGTYDSVAWTSDQAFDQSGAPGATTSKFARPSPFQIKVDPAQKSFTVLAQLPEGNISRTYVGSSDAALHSSSATSAYYGDFGYHIDFTYAFSDGTKSAVHSLDIDKFSVDVPVGADSITRRLQTSATTYEQSRFFTGIGLKYVSFGEWLLDDFVTDAVSSRQTRSRTAEIVYGARTVPSDMPASGTASYSDANDVLHLSADFGARTIGANLDYPARVVITPADDSGPDIKYAVAGVRASGSSPITSLADFSIPLTGTSITPDVQGKLPDVIEPVTGTFAGAFFGPQATEVGGLAEIIKANGGSLWAGVPFLLGRK